MRVDVDVRDDGAEHRDADQQPPAERGPGTLAGHFGGRAVLRPAYHPSVDEYGDHRSEQPQDELEPRAVLDGADGLTAEEIDRLLEESR